MAKIGSVIINKYEILKLIGRGGMSKVYLAMDIRLNKQWAVKEIEKKAYDKNNEVVIQSAIAEANMIKKLDHPSLPRIVDIIDNGNVIYVVMDYIEGEALSKVVDEYGAQPQDIVIEWAMQLCDVLDYLHTRTPPIIYRDMKPGNIMLKPDGNIKLIDFGIAREYKEKNLADTVSLGTRGYAAPEQFGGKGQTDARTDIYCLGVTLYHLITGQNPSEPPYEIYPIRHWNPQLSAGLEAIIQKCIQLNPEDRYQSCAELMYALQHYEEYGAEYRARQKKKLNMFIYSAIATILCLFIGIFGTLMKNKTNGANYEKNMLNAQKSSQSSEKMNYYAKAIDINPVKSDAYIGMIEAIKDDASFTIDEEKIFTNKINTNMSLLRKEKDYSDLAFEIGKLYWYYYDYGKSESSDNQITRMKSSIQWFNDVVEYGESNTDNYKIATVYRDIGQFNKDITLNIEEASDKGLYLPYWNNMKELIDLVSNDENEIVKLEVYRLAMYSIETYARKFKSDDISQQDMIEIYDLVKQKTEDISTTSDKTETIKNDILNRASSTQKAITNAYRESVIEE